jgi:hypothetical protein
MEVSGKFKVPGHFTPGRIGWMVSSPGLGGFREQKVSISDWDTNPKMFSMLTVVIPSGLSQLVI